MIIENGNVQDIKFDEIVDFTVTVDVIGNKYDLIGGHSG